MPDITDVTVPSTVKLAGSIMNRKSKSIKIKIDKSWKYHRGIYLENNTLRLESVFKEGMIEQKNSDSPFILWADPKIAKLLSGLCWCCGRPRILINLGVENGWQETCIHSGITGFRKKRCRYARGKGCSAKDRTRGNCKGKCKDSEAS